MWRWNALGGNRRIAVVGVCGVEDDVGVVGTSNLFLSSRRRHTRLQGDWSSDVCSSDLSIGHLLGYSVEASGEHQWSVHRSLNGLVIRHAVDRKGHRQAELNPVSGLPDAVECEIAARAGECGQ